MQSDEIQVIENENLEIQDTIFLSFNVGDEVYAINIKHVTEIIRLVKITPIPEVYSFMKGVINLRGKVIPVMCIRLRLGMEEVEPDDRTCVVVVNVKGLDLGIIVDCVSEVIDIPEDRIDPSPKIRRYSNKDDNRNKYIAGIGKLEDGIKIIIDLEKMVFDYDMEKVLDECS